jgi:hypothetical protein
MNAVAGFHSHGDRPVFEHASHAKLLKGQLPHEVIDLRSLH